VNSLKTVKKDYTEPNHADINYAQTPSKYRRTLPMLST